MVGAVRLKAHEDITVLVVGLDNSSWLVECRCYCFEVICDSDYVDLFSGKHYGIPYPRPVCTDACCRSNSFTSNSATF